MSPIGDIPEPTFAAPRLSSRAFPSYRFVPGVHPHPTRDPRGHSHAISPRAGRHAVWRPDDWRMLDAWLYGIDLFNAHYFWEAHEAWEALWAVAPRDRPPALLLQGLIQIAAALLKIHMGVMEGARVLSRDGLDKMRRASRESPHLMGLDVEATALRFARYFAPVSTDVLPSLRDAPAIECVTRE